MADPFQYKSPDYNQFSLDTGFQYGSLFDQLKDAFSMPGRGAGQFNGNKLARYATPAPQVTVDPFYNTLMQFMQMQKPQGNGMLGGRPSSGVSPTPTSGGRARGLL